MVDSIINKLNLKEVQLPHHNLLVLDIESIFHIFNIKKNVENFNSMNPKSLNVLIDLAIREAIKMGSSYHTNGNNDVDLYYTTKNNVENTIRLIWKFFNHTTQAQIEKLNSIGLDLPQILIDKKFIESSENLDELLNNTNFVTNAINNPSLTKTILNNDSLINALGTEGIIDLISHLKYAESSNYLLKNCQLALVLYQKGAIENITVDYLFNSTQIQSDVTEFLKDVELTDAGDNITLSMDEVIDSVFDVVNEYPFSGAAK